jgi:hypothetical protein
MSQQHLAELERSLSGSASDGDFARWWRLVELITSDLVCDEGTSNRERSLVAELRASVAELIADIREEAPSPSSGRARLSASALWLSIVTRITRSHGRSGAAAQGPPLRLRRSWVVGR